MSHHATPLKFLMPGWFAIVMGLCGLALAWHRATPLMGEMAGAGALVVGALAALVAAALAVLSLLRWQRYPQAVAEDLSHPVRHVFVAAMPISLLLLATVAAALAGPSLPAKGLWVVGSLWQFGVTIWVLSRWLRPNIGGKDGTPFWPSITPALFIPVVGNVLPPLAGVTLGFPEWSAAQFGVGLFLWPVALTLLAVRVGVSGMWPERLLPTTFITIAPPAVIGLAALQLGAPVLLAWVAWGIGLFFLAWSATVFRRAVSQAFSVPFWAMSFPLAAFSALTLRLAQEGSGAFQAVAMILLALASLVIAALALATVKGLRDGSLLAPEPVAALNLAAAPGEPGAR
jgi:tellurite resistance protein